MPLQSHILSECISVLRSFSVKSSGPQVCVEVVGYLLEELRDPKNYAEFQRDIATANIFIGSLIFIEELADKVSCTGLLVVTQPHCKVPRYIPFLL